MVVDDTKRDVGPRFSARDCRYPLLCRVVRQLLVAAPAPLRSSVAGQHDALTDLARTYLARRVAACASESSRSATTVRCGRSKVHKDLRSGYAARIIHGQIYRDDLESIPTGDQIADLHIEHEPHESGRAGRNGEKRGFRHRQIARTPRAAIESVLSTPSRVRGMSNRIGKWV